MKLKIYINKGLLFQVLIMCLSYIVLLYMHYSVVADKSDISTFAYIENLCFSAADICLISIIPTLCIKRRHYFFLLLFSVICLFALANIWYSRYFSSYLPLSLYTEFNNLDGLSENITDAVKTTDFFVLTAFLAGIVCYCIFCKKLTYITFKIRARRASFIGLTSILLVGILVGNSALRWKDLTWKYVTPYNYTPVESTFQFGMIYSYLIESLKKVNKDYSVEELKKLSPYFYVSDYVQEECKPTNLILIIVESLLSYPTELVIDSIEITPNLNQLVKEGAYYNKHMIPQVKLGESSNGQFIYLTGLLPKKQGITINDYLDNTFISIPSLLKKENINSRMVIPTSPTMWRQNRVCERYQIDQLFSRNSYPDQKQVKKWLTDQQIFNYAACIDAQSNKPFMSIILTSSTHSPYVHSVKKYPIKYPDNFSSELKNYLSNVHYMDECLGNYLNSLKRNNLYNSSIIVIVSDHQAHDFLLNAETQQITSLIPLYIVNSPVKINKKMITQSLNQMYIPLY
ncbi:LTA synthase family protein [Bacteroides fragilis]|uniref:LTA synthase family protein n=1 Tax=Bacteroides fragilis TaxID=817 RepID=UPI001C70708A|nr:alkaline phosphatase family protein [Bacteroides fragilis]MBW9276410.1 LTA synthase family protein [Bacteroides fragilis]